jgi:hypothetical protein
MEVMISEDYLGLVHRAQTRQQNRWDISKDRQCTYKCNNEERSRNHCCREKAINISYSECVSAALVIQRALCMRCIIILYVALPYFFHITSKTARNFANAPTMCSCLSASSIFCTPCSKIQTPMHLAYKSVTGRPLSAFVFSAV